MARSAVDFYFAEQREAGLIVKIAEGLDLFLRARFLSAKLIAWKGEHRETRALKVWCRCSNPVYCGVNPHLEAVLTMSSTLPLNSLRF